jgi:hypothetical protein
MDSHNTAVLADCISGYLADATCSQELAPEIRMLAPQPHIPACCKVCSCCLPILLLFLDSSPSLKFSGSGTAAAAAAGSWNTGSCSTTPGCSCCSPDRPGSIAATATLLQSTTRAHIGSHCMPGYAAAMMVFAVSPGRTVYVCWMLLHCRCHRWSCVPVCGSAATQSSRRQCIMFHAATITVSRSP